MPPRPKRLKASVNKTKGFYAENTDDENVVKTSRKVAGTTRKRRSVRKPAPKTDNPKTTTNSSLVLLDSDDDKPSSSGVSDLVQRKVKGFINTINLSDDEDSVETTPKVRQEPTSSDKKVFELSDSEDETLKFKKLKGDKSEKFEANVPSTSKTCFNLKKSDTVDLINNDDSFMESSLINAPLEDGESVCVEESYDLKSLEDYRKETEELLSSVSASINEFKTVKEKPKPQVPIEESPKKSVGSCPICLESLSSKPLSATICGHIFCKECITEAAKRLKQCPTCRKKVTLKNIHPIFL